MLYQLQKLPSATREEIRELGEIQLWRGAEVEVDYAYFPGEPATHDCPISEPDGVELVCVRVIATGANVVLNLTGDEEAELKRECLAEARRHEELRKAFRR